MKRLSDEALFVEVTLDEGVKGSDNEDDAQLNTQTDDNQPTKRPTDQPTTMEITPDHPVYVEGKGWLWAENLAVGDRLRRADGGWAKVLAVERVKLAEPESVYNFTVKGPHTYFVLEVGVLVHNASCGDIEEGYVWRPNQSDPNLSPTKKRLREIPDNPDYYQNITPNSSSVPEPFKVRSCR